MHAIHSTGHPATTVEHSVQCRFYNFQETNLVTAGSNRLTVFRIVDNELEYVQAFTLYGSVASIDKVTLGGKQTSRDSLTLCFHDAKLSIVEYDPETHDLKTVSMHYFEDDNLRGGCVTNHIAEPKVRVDPDNRCIAVLIYGRHIMIIPIEKDEEEDLENELYNTSPDSAQSDNEEQIEQYDRRGPRVGQVVSLKPAETAFVSPVLPSYQIDLSYDTCGEKINDIRDLQFLHNYNDPTLVIMFESIRTWSGRIAVRQDTFSMVAFSMNVQTRLQPIIWTHNHLPYDCSHMIPVPKPIGGLLVVAANELIYLNQSVPAFGMSFNSFSKDSTSFPLQNVYQNQESSIKTCTSPTVANTQGDINSNGNNSTTQSCSDKSNASSADENELSNLDPSDTVANNKKNNNDGKDIDDIDEYDKDSNTGKVLNDSSSSNNIINNNDNNDNDNDNDNNDDSIHPNISLDLSRATFLTQNKLLFVLKDGTVYLVTLFNDDMRSIKDFHFERIASTVQPNCLTLLADNLLFVGSHVGDSVLAELTGDFKSNRAAETAAAAADATQAAAYDGDDVDSLMSIYGEESEKVKLVEIDRLATTSCSGRMCYGEIPGAYLADQEHRDELNVELITTSGSCKDGAVCVYQRTVKPIVEDTYELKSCGALWTVRSAQTQERDGNRLFLNRYHQTILFSTKGELLELPRDNCAFELKEQTLLAANVGAGHEYILQVTATGAKLISNDTLVDKITFEQEILDACIADEHVLMLRADNSFYHLRLNVDKLSSQSEQIMDDDDDDASPTFSLNLIEQPTSGRVITFSLYKDVSGLFTTESRPSPPLRPDETPEHSYWLALVDDRGVLIILSVPDFRTVFSVDNLPSLPGVLSDNIKVFVTDVDPNAAKTREILLCSLGRNDKQPLLLIRSAWEVCIYAAFSFREVDIGAHLKLRFRKIHTILADTIVPARDLKSIETNPLAVATVENTQMPIASSHENTQQQQQQQQQRRGNKRRARDEDDSNNYSSKRHKHDSRQARPTTSTTVALAAPDWSTRDNFWDSSQRHMLHKFTSISGHKGLFVAGQRPHWILMSKRGMLRVHPMTVDGAVLAFAQHDANNFIYYTERRELRIARLTSRLDMDSEWPMRKLSIGETVHFVNYHVDRKLYCVVTSSPVPCRKLMKVGSEPDTMKVEELDREGGYIPPTTEKFRLRVYEPTNWEQVPDCDLEFEEWEQVTCVKNVSLASEGTSSGLKGYIALSTNYCYGEDVPNRGRIWILDLIEVVPEPDRPLTCNKIKKIYCQEQKGPVTTLSHTCGLLLSAVGQKIYLWQLKEGRLDGVAFIDTQIYIHCTASVKNLILVSDVCKSISLLRFQQETRTLSMVARDPKPLEVFACDFLVDNEQLSFVITDNERNLFIFTHDPTNESSQGGTRLLRRADFYIGAHVTAFSRVRARVPIAAASKDAASTQQALLWRRRHVTLFVTVDGAICRIMPIDQSSHHRLRALQFELCASLPHAAGLNPRAWRTARQARVSLKTPCELIVDGDLLARYLTLSLRERNELARRIGCPADELLADLQMIDESMLHF